MSPSLPFQFRLLSKIRSQNSGQSIIEVALMLPIVFMMTFGLINFCLILFSMGNANFASRAALRYVSVHSLTSYAPTTQSGLNSVIAPYVYSYPANTYNISVSYYDTYSNPAGNTVGVAAYVTLNISYTFSVLGHTYAPLSYNSTGCGFVLQ